MFSLAFNVMCTKDLADIVIQWIAPNASTTRVEVLVRVALFMNLSPE